MSKIDEALKRRIKQVVLEIQLERELVKGFRLLEHDVVRQCRTQRLNEGLDTVIGLILSGPYIVKLFGKFISYMDSIVKKFNKKGFGGQEIAQKIIEFSEKYHHKIMWVFEKVAGMFTKDPHKKEEIADLLFTGVISAFLVHSTGDIIDRVQSSVLDSEVMAKGMKAAIKAGEVWDGIKNALRAIMPKVVSIVEK